MLYLRSLSFMIGMVFTIVVFALLALLIAPLPHRWRYGFISQWSRINLWWLARTCKLNYVVEGREHIPAGAGIILCKHQSAWETLALQQIFPPQIWVLKRELLWLPFFGWGLALLKPIAIDRKAGKRALATLLKQGEARLAQGLWVVIFPEGTRVAPGEHRRYAPGGAILAVKSGYPVIPVAHNAGEFWPRHGFLKRPGTIRLVIGPPLDPRGRSANDINSAVQAWIEEKTAQISTRSTHSASAATNICKANVSVGTLRALD